MPTQSEHKHIDQADNNHCYARRRGRVSSANQTENGRTSTRVCLPAARCGNFEDDLGQAESLGPYKSATIRAAITCTLLSPLHHALDPNQTSRRGACEPQEQKVRGVSAADSVHDASVSVCVAGRNATSPRTTLTSVKTARTTVSTKVRSVELRTSVALNGVYMRVVYR